MTVKSIRKLSAGSKPFTCLIEPFAGCNMSCAYCYSDIFSNKKMSLKTLEMILSRLKEYSEENNIPKIDIIWHGGEPMSAGLNFYEYMIFLCKKNGYGNLFKHYIKTNGTLLTDEWCRFLSKNDIQVSVSLDGPLEINDQTRKMRSNNENSYDIVIKKTKLLKKYSIPYNFLVVVSKVNYKNPEELYSFFRGLCVSFKVNPVMKSRFKSSEFKELQISSNQYGTFLTRLFDIWMKDENSPIRIGTLDTYIRNVATGKPYNCQHKKSCINHILGIKHDGTASICSRFQDKSSFNLTELKISDLKNFIPFSEVAIRYDLLGKCKTCEFYHICYGGCPDNSYSYYDNYMKKDHFCSAYKMIYSKIKEFLKDHSECI